MASRRPLIPCTLLLDRVCANMAGAVRQVRGDVEVGFRGLGWVPLRGARQLPAASSGGGLAERGRGALYRVSSWAGRFEASKTGGGNISRTGPAQGFL